MKMEQVCTVKTKRLKEWFVPKEWLDFNIFNNNKKSFVYIKIDITRVIQFQEHMAT